MSRDKDEALLELAWRHFRQGQPRWYAGAVVRTVVALSRFVMMRMNRLELDGIERFEAALGRSGVGLLTYSNHVALLDDPWLISCFGLPAYDRIRWVAADAKNFFSSQLKGIIFSAGKCVPVVRGLGLDQPGFDFLAERLRSGDWVHLFPEGGRTRESDSRLKVPFKAGIGRLIDAAEPWVMPFYHVGMEAILPVGSRLPRRGNTVRCIFGQAERVDRRRIVELTGDSAEPRDRARRLTQWTQTVLEAMEREHRPAD